MSPAGEQYFGSLPLTFGSVGGGTAPAPPPPPPPTPTLLLTAPSPATGTVGVPATGGAVSLVNGTGTVAFTLSSSPTSVIVPASGVVSGTAVPYTITALTAAVHSISITNTSGLANPAPVSFSSAAAPPPPPPPPVLTLTPPAGGSGATLSSSAPFTVTVANGTATYTVTAAVSPSAVVTPSTFGVSNGVPGYFTITPPVDGVYSVSITNSAGVAQVGSPANYTSSTAVVAVYRNAQTKLFQAAPSAVYPTALGGTDYNADRWGPTADYVDYQTGWAWANQGGDWIDSAGASQGASSFLTATLNAVSGSAATHTYSGIDCSSLVQYAQTHAKPLAVLFNAAGGVRWIATLFHATMPAPSIFVTYTDATTATLPARVVAANTTSSTQPVTAANDVAFPAFVEFDRPTKAVASATLTIAVTQHWSGTSTLSAFLLNPPINAQPVVTGLASASSAYDATLSAVAGVVGTMRFQDGSALTDWVVPGAMPITSEVEFSPEYWGGAANTAKLPYAYLGTSVAGKLVNVPASGVSLVASTYTGDGFVPVASGLGALRLEMPSSAVVSGGSYDNNGTMASNMCCFMPPADYGTKNHLFVRYYMLIGTPDSRTPSDRPEVYSASVPKWLDLAGKTGIAPDCSNSYGGVSGNSGGGVGWQMRLIWGECDAGLGGPEEGGQYMGFHLYDYQAQNPVGHRYGTEKPAQWERWGDLGGIFYAGRQYCVETEIKLNTIDIVAGTYLADGELRAWVDGRLVYERTGMVFRTLPAYSPAYSTSSLRPPPQLGITRLWLDWFHGGQTPSNKARVNFYSALAWADSYIGPINTTAYPSWRPAAGEVTTLTVANGRLSNSWLSQCNSYYDAVNFCRCRNDYSSGDVDPYWGTYGAMIFFGGGHASTNNNAAVALEVGEVCTFKRLNNATPIYGSGTDATTKSNNSLSVVLVASGLITSYCVHNDGQPASPHSYACLTVLPPSPGAACGSLFFPTIGAVGFYGFYGAVTAHRMALPSASLAAGGYHWTWVADHPTYPTGFSNNASFQNNMPAPLWTWHDAGNNRVFYQTRSGYYPMARWFDLATSTYHESTGTGLNLTDAADVDQNMFVNVPERNLVVFVYRSSSTGYLRARYMDYSVANPSWVSLAATFNVDVSLPVNWACAGWCSANSRIIVGGVGLASLSPTGTTTSSVWELAIPAVLTDQWTLTERPLGAGQTLPWSPNNCYKAWSYNPKAGCFIYFPHADTGGVDTVYAYRPYGT